MCEYCGCQAPAAVAELTAEHDLLVELARQAREAAQAGRVDLAAARGRDVAAVLAPHTVVEEGALFPALADAFPRHAHLPEQWDELEGLPACVGGATRARS